MPEQILGRPGGVGDDGRDRYGRLKWIVAGDTPDGIAVESRCERKLPGLCN
jgi:hypothetical protein